MGYLNSKNIGPMRRETKYPKIEYEKTHPKKLPNPKKPLLICPNVNTKKHNVKKVQIAKKFFF